MDLNETAIESIEESKTTRKRQKNVDSSDNELLDLNKRSSVPRTMNEFDFDSLPSSIFDDYELPVEDAVGTVCSLSNGSFVIETAASTLLTVSADPKEWHVELHDKVQLIGPASNPRFVVAHPDTLISATFLADSFTCPRRAVLSGLTLPALEDSRPSVSLIVGSVLHEAVQAALQIEQRLSDDELREFLRGKLDDL